MSLTSLPPRINYLSTCNLKKRERDRESYIGQRRTFQILELSASVETFPCNKTNKKNKQKTKDEKQKLRRKKTKRRKMQSWSWKLSASHRGFENFPIKPLFLCCWTHADRWRVQARELKCSPYSSTQFSTSHTWDITHTDPEKKEVPTKVWSER